MATEAASVDRDRFDHRKDLPARDQTECFARAPGHPRQQALATEAKLNFECPLLDRDQRLDPPRQHIQCADPDRRSQREDHVPSADAHPQGGADRRVQQGYHQLAKSAGKLGKPPAGIVRRDAHGDLLVSFYSGPNILTSRSTDQGAHWEKAQTVVEGASTEIAMTRLKDGTILWPFYQEFVKEPCCQVRRYNTYVYRSTDNGKTWQPSRVMLESGSGQFDPQIVVDPADRRTLYAAWLQNKKRVVMLAKSVTLTALHSVEFKDRMVRRDERARKFHGEIVQAVS